jgi:hypothetical protein
LISISDYPLHQTPSKKNKALKAANARAEKKAKRKAFSDEEEVESPAPKKNKATRKGL